MTYTQELEKALDMVGEIANPPIAIELFSFNHQQIDALRIVIAAARLYLEQLR